MIKWFRVRDSGVWPFWELGGSEGIRDDSHCNQSCLISYGFSVWNVTTFIKITNTKISLILISLYKKQSKRKTFLKELCHGSSEKVFVYLCDSRKKKLSILI